MVPIVKLTTHDTMEDENLISLYQLVVGGLQYVTITRPNIAYVVNKVCQFMHAPMDSHWQAVKKS